MQARNVQDQVSSCRERHDIWQANMLSLLISLYFPLFFLHKVEFFHQSPVDYKTYIVEKKPFKRYLFFSEDQIFKKYINKSLAPYLMFSFFVYAYYIFIFVFPWMIIFFLRTSKNIASNKMTPPYTWKMLIVIFLREKDSV